MRSDSSQHEAIEKDGAVAEAALSGYLSAKYGLGEEDYTVVSNVPELTSRYYSGGKARTAKDPVYSGYYLAEIELGDDRAHVKYSPSGDTRMFALGGGDDLQREELEAYVRGLVLSSLSFKPDRIRIKAGDVIASDEAPWSGVRVLGSRFDGEDYVGPIATTPEGCLGAQLFYDTIEPDVEAVESELSRLFEDVEVDVVAGIHHDASGSDMGLTFWLNSSARALL